MKSVLVFPDGKEISSGVGKNPAIKSLSFSRTAVADADFFYGSACASIVEFTLMDKTGEFIITPGDSFNYYEEADDGSRKKIGLFSVSTVKKASPYSLAVTAADNMTELDKDLSTWLTELDVWPYTMNQLLAMTAEACGISVADGTELINGEHTVPRFIMPLTGRKMVQWICQANACFALMNENGVLTFRTLQERGDLTAAIKKVTVSDFSTAPISRVVVKQSQNDVGVFWPKVEGESYEILRNPLLATFSQETLLPVVQKIAEKVVGLTYTPSTIVAWDPAAEYAAGDVFAFKQGKTEYKTIVFSEKRAGSTVTLKSTGNSSRTAYTAVYGQDPVEVIQGRVAEIKVDLEGVSASLGETIIAVDSVRQSTSEVKQTASGLQLRVESTEKTVEGMTGRVASLETDSSSMELSIVSIRSQVEEKADTDAVEEFTKKFRFDENGLTISNSATGMGIGISEEQVAFTGGKNPTTVITPSEMETTNLKVGQRLDLGNFSLIPRTNGNLSMRWTGGLDV